MSIQLYAGNEQEPYKRLKINNSVSVRFDRCIDFGLVNKVIEGVEDLKCLKSKSVVPLIDIQKAGGVAPVVFAYEQYKKEITIAFPYNSLNIDSKEFLLALKQLEGQGDYKKYILPLVKHIEETMR